MALCLLAAACVLARLLCNLLDGLLAVEGGQGDATGALFNELPERLSDMVLFVGAGYAARSLPGSIELGWGAALVAVTATYVRLLGAGLGQPHDYCGPLAKPQRMAVLFVASLVAAAELPGWSAPAVLRAALVLIVAGTTATAVRRTIRLYKRLAASGQATPLLSNARRDRAGTPQ